MERNSLRCEVITTRAQRRATRRNVALAAAAAAIGGAVGTGVVVLTVLPLASSQTSSTYEPADIVSMQPAGVDIAELDIADITELRPIAKAPPPATGHPAFILHADTPRFVLSPDIEVRWLQRGSAKMASDDDLGYVLERRVDARAVPATYTALVGRRAALFDDKGNRCEATVGELSAVLSIVEDFQDKPDTAARRNDAWSYGEPALVARVDDIEGSCEGTLVAGVIVASETDPGRITTAPISTLAEDHALTVHARAAFASIPEYAAIQKAFEKQGGSGAWQTEASVTLVGGSERGIAVLSTSVGGCGEFEATLTAVFEIRDGALAARVVVPSDVAAVSLAAAADTNGDGVPELFVNRWFRATSIWTSSEKGYTEAPGADVVAHFCSC